MSILNWVFERGESLVVRVCEALSKRARDSKTFMTEGSPYLSRYFLLRKAKPGDEEDAADRPFSVFLHYFHRGDEDVELHNHPWGFSFSIVLTNGYLEERWTRYGVRTRKIRPGSLNILRSSDFHRVDLINPNKGAWTVFFAGRRVQDWGFWHPQHRPEFVPWRTFVKNRDGDARQPVNN